MASPCADMRKQIPTNPQVSPDPLDHFEAQLVASYNSLFTYSKDYNSSFQAALFYCVKYMFGTF